MLDRPDQWILGEPGGLDLSGLLGPFRVGLRRRCDAGRLHHLAVVDDAKVAGEVGQAVELAVIGHRLPREWKHLGFKLGRTLIVVQRLEPRRPLPEHVIEDIKRIEGRIGVLHQLDLRRILRRRNDFEIDLDPGVLGFELLDEFVDGFDLEIPGDELDGRLGGGRERHQPTRRRDQHICTEMRCETPHVRCLEALAVHRGFL